MEWDRDKGDRNSIQRFKGKNLYNNSKVSFFRGYHSNVQKREIGKVLLIVSRKNAQQ